MAEVLDEQQRLTHEQWLQAVTKVTAQVAKHHLQNAIDCIDLEMTKDAQAHSMLTKLCLENDYHTYLKLCKMCDIQPFDDNWKKVLANQA